MASSIITAIVGSLASSIVGSILGGDEDEPKAPVVPAATPMPEADDEAIRKARMRAAMRRMATNRGRSSTILSDSGMGGGGGGGGGSSSPAAPGIVGSSTTMGGA